MEERKINRESISFIFTVEGFLPDPSVNEGQQDSLNQWSGGGEIQQLYQLGLSGTQGKASLSMAFLYQSMEKCGADGGLILKPPLIFICGSFNFGRLHEK